MTKATADLYNIPLEAAAQMDAAMNVAASDFWAYPDQKWQLNFERGWLQENGYMDAARKAAESVEEQA